jgi:hypothetical protein
MNLPEHLAMVHCVNSRWDGADSDFTKSLSHG